MRKTYIKPQIMFEDFRLDADILEGTIPKEMLDALRDSYESSEEFLLWGMSWEEYLAVALERMGYDNPSSGYCYHTVADVS